MIYQLMRRDPAWRLAPRLALAGAVLLPALGSLSLLTLAIVIFANLWIMFITIVKPYQRCDLLEATLPIEARDLLSARFLSLLAMVWLPVAAGAMVLQISGDAGKGVVSGLIEYAATMTLAIVINLAVRPREFAAPRWVSFVLWACAMILTSARFAFLKTPTRELMSGILLCASLLLFARIRSTLPASFQVRDETVDAAVSSPERLVFAWKPVVRSMVSWRILIFLIQPAFFSFAFGWLFAALQVPAGPTQLLTDLGWTSTLPIPRRHLLRICVLPVVSLTFLAYCVYWSVSAYRGPIGGHQVRIQHAGGPRLVVPVSYWQVAPGGHVPAIRAPWNEPACAVETQHLLGVTLYNPWSATPCNSHEFLQWQQQRANLAIYGSTSPWSKEMPRTRQPAMLVVDLGLVLILGMTALFLIHAKRWMRVTERVRTVLFRCGMALMVALFACILLPLFVTSKNILSDGLLFRLSLLFPGSAWIISAATVALVGAVYWALEKQFEDVELFTQCATGSNRVSLFGNK